MMYMTYDIYDIWLYGIYDHESLKGTYIPIYIYGIHDSMIYMTYDIYDYEYMKYMTVRVSKAHI